MTTITAAENLLDQRLLYRSWIKERMRLNGRHLKYNKWQIQNEVWIEDLLEKLNYPLIPFLEIINAKNH